MRAAVVLMAVLCLQYIQAKPYTKEKQLTPRTYGDNPFAPPDDFSTGPILYDRSNKWMSWNPDAVRGKDPVDNENKITDTSEKKSEKEKEPFFEDPCKNVYCHYGRECQPTESGRGQCVCAGADFCRGHHKSVCGTDGVRYPSHCELHRMACVKRAHIGIDHSAKGCPNTDEDKVEPLPEVMAVKIKVSKEKLIHQDKKIKDATDNKDKDLTEKDDIVKKDEIELEDDSEQAVDVKPTPSTTSTAKLEVEEVKDALVEPERKPLVPCTDLEFDHFKNNLIQYHCARIGEHNCQDDPTKRQFVSNIMFNYYDHNSDQLLSEVELDDIAHRDHLDKLSHFCRLTDVLTFDDQSEDGNISLAEFYSAFRVATVLLDDSLKLFTSLVTIGNSIELKCDVRGPGATEIVWRRNGALLDEITSNDIKVFEDGSLYIGDLGLHHMGNYSCHDRLNERVVQTHVLRVQMPPTVRVSPATQFHTSGASVVLKCHADGVPQPDISWQMNEAPLPDDPKGDHYLMLHNNATLEIKSATYTRDTGAYKCKAHSTAGASQDIATVFIENSNVPKYSSSYETYEVFVVFHDKGYTVFEPNHCHIEHQVSGGFSGFKQLPEYGDTVTTLCLEGESCQWGSAVNVQNKYIYITQPNLNRIIVIEIRDRSNPIEVILTDKFPVRIEYLAHLDQVWVLCWNQHENTGSKTSVIIRSASEDMHHRTVHTQPVGNKFDKIEDVFLPNANDLGHKFQYGYVAHADQQSLYKLDLASMEYVKHIDLKDYQCVPKGVAFIPLGGQIHVHCVAPLGLPPKSSRVVLDYVTDAVKEHTLLGGEPYITPDARHLVTVQDDGNTISVSKLHDDGKIEHVFDEYTNLHISDITFFPSERGHGYDFYASSANKNDMLYINLDSGKVEMIEGVGEAMSQDEWPFNTHNRVIVSGGVFGEYLMSPSRDSVVVIDGRRRHIQCEWQNIRHGNVIVWVEPMHL